MTRTFISLVLIALAAHHVSAQTPVASQTVTTPASSVTLAIPSSAAGSHLRIRVLGASDAPYEHVSVGLQINGDTGQNYGWVNLWAIGGVPPDHAPSSGGDDEWRARVGLVPGAAMLVPHAAGETEIVIPDYQGTTFQRLIRFDSSESLGITRSIRVVGSAGYYANKTGTGNGGGGGESNATMLGSVIYGGSYYSGQGPAGAFNDPSGWYSGISSSAPYIGRDFGSPVTLTRVEAQGTASFSFAGPVLYSDDGLAFTAAGTTLNLQAGTTALQSWPVSSGAHRFWAIADAQDDAYHQINELKFYATGVSGGGGGSPGPFGGNYGTLGSFTRPEPVTSITILLDVGNWVVGSIIQIYIEG